MANTINTVQTANTFGDWLVATNALAQEVTYIGKNNWTKDSGQLILNGSGNALQVANNALVQGQLLVQGSSSSAQIQNNLTVNGTLYANGTGSGLSVSNNAIVYGNITTTIIQANTSINTATLTAVTGATIAGVNIVPYTTAAFNEANSAYTLATSVSSSAIAAFGVANSAAITAQAAYNTANSGVAIGTSAGVYANLAYGVANSASIFANLAFTQANTALTSSANANNITSGTLNASRLPTSGVSAGTYGNSSNTVTIAVDNTLRKLAPLVIGVDTSIIPSISILRNEGIDNNFSKLLRSFGADDKSLYNFNILCC